MSRRLRIDEVRPALPRRYVTVHQRRRLIDAIVELTVEQGYEATTVNEIVKRARMGRATFYANFEGKLHLFLTAVEVTLAEAAVAVEAACREAEPEWEERVQAGLGALLVFADERRAAVRACTVDALAVPATSALHDAAIRRCVEQMRAHAPAGTGLPETTEEMLAGGVVSLIRQRFRSGRTGQFIDLLPELTKFVTAPYRNALTAA